MNVSFSSKNYFSNEGRLTYHYSIMLLKQEMIEPIVIEPIIKKSCPIGAPSVLAIICSYRDLCSHRYFTCVEYV